MALTNKASTSTIGGCSCSRRHRPLRRPWSGRLFFFVGICVSLVMVVKYIKCRTAVAFDDNNVDNDDSRRLAVSRNLGASRRSFEDETLLDSSRGGKKLPSRPHDKAFQNVSRERQNEIRDSLEGIHVYNGGHKVTPWRYLQKDVVRIIVLLRMLYVERERSWRE